jgi:XrtJ-associated TM-motif-TM protein
MKKTWILFFAAMLFLGVSIARAQSGNADDGCDSSPENPTVILAALGSTGAGLAALRIRLQARKARK